DLAGKTSDLGGKPSPRRIGKAKVFPDFGEDVIKTIDAVRMQTWVYPEWVTRYQVTPKEWLFFLYYPQYRGHSDRDRKRYSRIRKRLQKYVMLMGLYDGMRAVRVKEFARKKHVQQQ